MLRTSYSSVDEIRRAIKLLRPEDLTSIHTHKDALLGVRSDIHRATASLVYICLEEVRGSTFSAIQKAERIAICPYDLRWTGIRKTTSTLLRVKGLDTIDPMFGQRLTSYLNLSSVIRAHTQQLKKYHDTIQRRPPWLARTAIAATAAMCMFHADKTFPRDVLPEIFSPLSDSTDRSTDIRDLVELVASAASMLLAETHARTPLNRIELMFQVTPYIYSDFLPILTAAITIHEIRNARDQVSLLGNRIERHATVKGQVFNIMPANTHDFRSREIGKYLRQTAETYHLAPNELRLDPSSVPRAMRWTLREAPYRRYTYTLPELAFYDTSHSESVRGGQQINEQELFFNTVIDQQTAQIEGKPLNQMRADLGCLKRLAEMYCSLLASTPRTDRDALLNSLVTTFTDAGYRHLCGEDVAGRRRQDSYSCITWESGSSRSRLDLLYHPLIHVKDHYFLSLPIIHSSNLERNVLWSHTRDAKRFGSAAERFPEQIADFLRLAGIGSVTTNKKIKAKNSRSTATDLDVVLLAGNDLWIFECKFNAYGATVYEERDLLGDIRKGASQVNRALEILRSDPVRTWQQLRSWFPQARRTQSDVLNVRGGIILSVREYSGSAHGGIQIRDVFSLWHTINRGKIDYWRPTQSGERETVSRGFWVDAEFSYADFLAYWGEYPPALAPFYENFVEYTGLSELDESTLASYRGYVQLPPDIA